jgi:acetyl esterase/lipase
MYKLYVMNHAISFLFLLLITSISSMAQLTINLYSGAIPNSKPTTEQEVTEQRDGISIVSKITKPTLTIFLAPKETAVGTSVIICPGGGYWVNAISHEGTDVARKFNEMGVSAFVLKYRIPNDATMEKKEIGPLQDAQQAIKIVRQRASEWGLDQHRVGIMGFSAGGHLASTAGTHFNKSFITNEDKTNLRPDFMILIYPVISFQDAIGHLGSREQLIGRHPTPEQVNYFSNELQITETTPPTFLVHASDDNEVKVANSIVFYQNLINHKVPAELHVYEKGGHGFGMNNPTTTDKWMERCQNWMTANGWLKK